jgi:hypothetical protein
VPLPVEPLDESETEEAEAESEEYAPEPPPAPPRPVTLAPAPAAAAPPPPVVRTTVAPRLGPCPSDREPGRRRERRAAAPAARRAARGGTRSRPLPRRRRRRWRARPCLRCRGRLRPIAPPRPVGPHPTAANPMPQTLLPRSPHAVGVGLGVRPGMGARPGMPGQRLPGAPPQQIRPVGRATPSRRNRGPQMPPPQREERPAYTGPLRKLTLTEGVTVKELGEKMADVKSRDIMKALIARNVMATVNQALPHPLAIEICKEFGYEATIQSFEEVVVQEQKVESKPRTWSRARP